MPLVNPLILKYNSCKLILFVSYRPVAPEIKTERPRRNRKLGNCWQGQEDQETVTQGRSTEDNIGNPNVIASQF